MKNTLLLTTALIAVLSSPAMAEDNNSWMDTMKKSVQSWFGNEETGTPELEAYLDEVTIAVPPMTGEEAAAIMPAAGDYIEDNTDAMMTEQPSDAAPGSMGYKNDEQSSFDTEFTGIDGSVAALEDTMGADDLANIMPAAGDAEEITDESIVVVEDAAEHTADAAEDAAEAMHENVAEVMPEETTVEDAMDATHEAAADMADEAMDMANDAAEAVSDAAEDAMDATHEAVTDMVEDAKEAIETMTPAAGEAHEDATKMEEMAK